MPASQPIKNNDKISTTPNVAHFPFVPPPVLSMTMVAPQRRQENLLLQPAAPALSQTLPLDSVVSAPLSENEALNIEVKNLRKQCHELTQKLSILEEKERLHEPNYRERLYANLQIDARETQIRLQKVYREALSLRYERDASLQKNIDLENQMVALQKSHEDTSTSLINFSELSRRLESELTPLRHQLTAAENDVELLRAQNHSLQQQLITAKNDILLISNHNESQQASLNTLKQQLYKIAEQRKIELNNQMNAVNEQRQKAERELSILRDEVARHSLLVSQSLFSQTSSPASSGVNVHRSVTLP
jgi:chromosome segregation ATPase